MPDYSLFLLFLFVKRYIISHLYLEASSVFFILSAKSCKNPVIGFIVKFVSCNGFFYNPLIPKGIFICHKNHRDKWYFFVKKGILEDSQSI